MDKASPAEVEDWYKLIIWSTVKRNFPVNSIIWKHQHVLDIPQAVHKDSIVLQLLVDFVDFLNRSRVSETKHYVLFSFSFLLN